MTNDRLSELAIEHQLGEELDLENIVNDFANAKARKKL
jgi:hypothetical protein